MRSTLNPTACKTASKRVGKRKRSRSNGSASTTSPHNRRFSGPAVENSSKVLSPLRPLRVARAHQRKLPEVFRGPVVDWALGACDGLPLYERNLWMERSVASAPS